MRTSSKRIIAMGVLLLAVCFSPAGNAKGDFIDGMKGYWHFGTDLSSTVGGPALNATVGAGTPDPGAVGGQVGSCLHLYDTDNEYIVLPVGYGVSAGTGASLGADFTVSG